MKIGYARVSTKDQSLDLQIDALNEAGCQKIFQEKASGVKTGRPALKNMMSHLRPGDQVVVYKLDRLGRSLQHLIELINELKEKEVSFVSLKDGITLDDTAVGTMMFNIFAAFAQFERDIIRERTLAGLAAARARGKHGGRPKGLDPDAQKKAKMAATLYKSQEHTVREMCEHLSISVGTFYNYLRHEGVKIGVEQVRKKNAPANDGQGEKAK